MIREIKETWSDFTRPKIYQNFVEASYLILHVRKIIGVSVYTLISDSSGHIASQFSYIGFICFLIWYSAYFYAVCIVFSKDQTILRDLYNTKLRHYGDAVERISTTLFVIYTVWKLPYESNVNSKYAQQIVDIDKEIEKLGEPIDLTKYTRITLITASVQIIVTFARVSSVWISLGNLKTPLPYEKIFQVVYSDTLALIITFQYCVYLYVLKDRYRIVNRFLDSIQLQKTRAPIVKVGSKKTVRTPNMILTQYQDKYICEKIRTCGKIYGMLHGGSQTANRKYGLSITLNILLCYSQIILYLYYFMEATASGLFHDFQKYMDFIIYTFWQIIFAVGVIYLNIYFCQHTANEAKVTSHVVHKIINSEMNPLVRAEAVHLSLQAIHQQPSFTARGLFKIDYMLLLEGARTVVTFLVMLLQFVADTR